MKLYYIAGEATRGHDDVASEGPINLPAFNERTFKVFTLQILKKHKLFYYDKDEDGEDMFSEWVEQQKGCFVYADDSGSYVILGKSKAIVDEVWEDGSL